MANVLVMTDTVSCVPRDLAEQYNIKTVPAANIYVNGEVYIDGETITPTEAYDLIQKDPDSFMTSALTPEYLLGAYEKISAEAKEICFITLSGNLSAFNRVATLAAETFTEKSPDVTIRILDSRTCASSQGLVVLAAARAAAAGQSLDDVAAVAENARRKTGGIMMLDTLRYVYRTGRISKTASRIASLFNIRPINKMTDEGKLEMVDRTRKREEGLDKMLNLIEADAGTKSLHFMLTHAAAPDMAAHFADKLKGRFDCLSLITSDFSPVMGYGSGPGSLFAGYHPEL
ncbi:MAG: DegV family protein [Dehalococcoidales bacterium]|nr:DegV family protein [Dehalococcoidales bacterium]